MARLIALLTDFGMEDVYVGVMKGVMRRILPSAHFVDISHSIPPQNVRAGALMLLDCYRYFPPETVFLVIVDPGVGSARQPVVAEADGYIFVAPDNGILSYTLSESDNYTMYRLENPQYRLERVSYTFHGRDVFAPAAAHIARGVPPADFGPRQEKYFSIPKPELHIEGRHIVGEVIRSDHFGNLMTSIGRLSWLDDGRILLEPRFGEAQFPVYLRADEVEIRIHNQLIHVINHAFYEGARGNLIALVDSNGYLEIAINQGNAASRLDALPGDKVELFWE